MILDVLVQLAGILITGVILGLLTYWLIGGRRQ